MLCYRILYYYIPLDSRQLAIPLARRPRGPPAPGMHIDITINVTINNIINACNSNTSNILNIPTIIFLVN